MHSGSVLQQFATDVTVATSGRVSASNAASSSAVGRPAGSADESAFHVSADLTSEKNQGSLDQGNLS